MLLTTMSDLEINNQIQNEYKKIWDTTLERLLVEYDKERKKLKIDKTIPYIKDYHIKTKGKNTWIICIGKIPAVPKYENINHVTACCAVYYHTEKGVQLLVPSGENKAIILNPHFFKRYNERLNLNFDKTLDVMVHFLKYDKDIYDIVLPKEDRTNVIGYCKSGILLGEIHTNNKWLVWKTFVSRDLTRPHQHKKERQLVQQMLEEINANIDKPYFDTVNAIETIAKIKIILGLED